MLGPERQKSIIAKRDHCHDSPTNAISAARFGPVAFGPAGNRPQTAAKLADKGLRTWGDALFFLPLRYEDRRNPTAIADLLPGVLAVVRGSLASSGSWGRRGNMWRMELAQGEKKTEPDLVPL